MNDMIEKKYLETIISLEELRSIKASESVKKRFRELLIPSIMPLPAKRLPMVMIGYAIIALVVCLLFATTGGVIAAEESQPGDTLYPIKQKLENIERHLIPINNNSTDQKKTIPPPPQKQSILIQPATIFAIPSITITPEAVPTNTVAVSTSPMPMLSVAQKILPIKTSLSISSSFLLLTHTPTLADSRDTSIRADISTSLLPQVSANTPITHIGL